MVHTGPMLSRRELLAAAGLTVVGGWLGSTPAHAKTVVVDGHVITGPIQSLWAANKALCGRPVTNAYPVPGGTKQKFEKALMYHSRTSGASIIRGKVRETFAQAGGVAALGLPIGLESVNPTYACYRQATTGGRIWWSKPEGGKAIASTETVRLEGAPNFRDAAGTGLGIAVAGGYMRRGLLYRSDRLSDLSAMDSAILQDLGVTKVIDLRRPHVAEKSPDPSLPGVSYKLVDVFGPSVDESYYVSFVKTDYRRAQIRAVIKAVAAADEPMLLHCTHGKDRTGWIVAMIQLALGAKEASVVEQWLLSNTYLDRNALKRSSMAAGLSEVRQRYGSIEGYLTKGLRLSSSTRRALRQRFVV